MDAIMMYNPFEVGVGLDYNIHKYNSIVVSLIVIDVYQLKNENMYNRLDTCTRWIKTWQFVLVPTANTTRWSIPVKTNLPLIPYKTYNGHWTGHIEVYINTEEHGGYQPGHWSSTINTKQTFEFLILWVILLPFFLSICFLNLLEFVKKDYNYFNFL